MTTDIAVLPIGLTAGEAIERIRQLNDELEDLSYVYVVDDDGRLKGVISFRDLVFKRPGASLDEVMVPDPVSVNAFSDREEVSELAQRYQPVRDPGHRRQRPPAGNGDHRCRDRSRPGRSHRGLRRRSRRRRRRDGLHRHLASRSGCGPHGWSST